MNLRGKYVLVTGASSGIGQAIAIACAQKGLIVLINYRKNLKGAEQTLREVEKYSKGFIFQADLIDQLQIERMFEQIGERVGVVDLLVNNAGEAQPGDFFDNQRWQDQFENIFFSALHVTQCFLKQNIQSSLKKVVSITSYYGNLTSGNPNYFSYSVAKAALASMTVTLAKIDEKVLVNAIAPGYTWTPPWEGTSEAEKQACVSETIINRYVTADEIAQTAVGILENDALTGQIITVDGGLSVK